MVGGHDAWRIAATTQGDRHASYRRAATALPLRRDDAYDSAYATAAKLREAGVHFCIATDGRRSEAAHDRNLPYEASMAAAFGLPKDEALKSVTLYAAQILGVADQLGSLEPGKAATLIVTNGDPLDFPAEIEAAYIDGRKLDLTIDRLACATSIARGTNDSSLLHQRERAGGLGSILLGRDFLSSRAGSEVPR